MVPASALPAARRIRFASGAGWRNHRVPYPADVWAFNVAGYCPFGCVFPLCNMAASGIGGDPLGRLQFPHFVWIGNLPIWAARGGPASGYSPHPVGRWPDGQGPVGDTARSKCREVDLNRRCRCQRSRRGIGGSALPLLRSSLRPGSRALPVNRHANRTPNRRPKGTPFVTACANRLMFLCSAERGRFFAPA
jgi:hypothetical protein